MSWDIWLFQTPPGLASIDDLPSDYRFPPLDRRAVHDAARGSFGSVEGFGWVDGDGGGGTFAPVSLDEASFLRVDGPDVFGEIEMFGSEDGNAQGQLSINIRGGSDRMVSTILDFAAGLKVRAFDLQSGDWLTHDSGAGSFARWAAYRDHVVGEAGNPS